jgi:SecD/SecF fusion protein
MNRNNFWRFILVILVVVWSVYELYPPQGRPLLQVFQERAVNRDADYTNIMERVTMLNKVRPDREYGNLQEAASTNALARYFPFYDARNEVNPNNFILNRLQRQAAGRVRLGIDLKGGTSFLVEMDTNRLDKATDASFALNQAVEVLRKRVDRFGVAEPVIQPAGNNRILIQLPGLSESDKETAMRTIQKAAFLEFRMVHPESDRLVNEGMVEPGYEIMRRTQRDPQGRETTEAVMVRKRAEMDGSGIAGAMVVRGNLGEPEINFTLDSKGAARFADITRENVGQRLAIILDGELYSAPVIRSAIETGSGSISGKFDDREAFELANVLQNPLRAPLSIIESREVDPTLGRDSIRSGIKSALIGTAAVAAFMLIYYMVAGVVANIALMLNIVILLGVMCSIGTTLTLPGIAGIVLTIGMAVDANVLIFERMREELAAGKSLRGAVSAGYDKAFGTIFDSNLTTLISSVILIFMGTGPIKGFGVTLTIGVSVSMFTALVVTRLMFDWMLARNLLPNLNMLHLVRGANFDFMKYAKPAFLASWLLIVVGLGYGFKRGQDVLGVEFAGGNTITMNFAQKVPVDQIRSSTVKSGVGDVLIAYQRDISSGKENLRLTTRLLDAVKKEGAAASPVDSADKVINQLRNDFPAAGFQVTGVDRVGPTVGAEIRTAAISAGLLALFGILVYVAFRYEFSFAVGAVIAIIHDLLMTAGWYFLAGRELNASTVAALLTIIGFSINDTIVIFDRIREDLKLGLRGSFREIMNQALNQTLSRTIITSGTVFLATLSLYLFGGGVINDFAFTFLVGIITGTYSSIYIASAIVLWWHKGQRPQLGAGQVAIEGASQSRA